MTAFYTSPSASAADATFPASSSYSSPSASAADAAFPKPQATGFSTTHFGLGHVVPGWVPGWKAATFGAVSGNQHWNAASLGNVTRFSWAQTAAATPLRPTHFGTPVATSTTPIFVGALVMAAGFVPTTFGTPNAAWPLAGVATGFFTTHLGTPRSVQAVHPTGLFATHVGTPTAVLKQHAAALRPVHFGTVKQRQTQAVPSSLVYTHFGTPKAYRPTAYPARGWLSTRTGRPSAVNRFNHPATSWRPVHFGTPLAKETHIATAVSTCVKFGTPLVVRTPAC